MNTSILIARIVCIVYLSFGLGMMLSKDFYVQKFSKILEDTSFLLLGGMIAIVSGVAITNYHPIWEFSWKIIITLIGWIAVLKGIILIVFPRISSLYGGIITREFVSKIAVPMCLILGFVMGYFGFIA